jgi:hypothetical protein
MQEIHFSLMMGVFISSLFVVVLAIGNKKLVNILLEFLHYFLLILGSSFITENIGFDDKLVSPNNVLIGILMISIGILAKLILDRVSITKNSL